MSIYYSIVMIVTGILLLAWGMVEAEAFVTLVGGFVLVSGAVSLGALE